MSLNRIGLTRASLVALALIACLANVVFGQGVGEQIYWFILPLSYAICMLIFPLPLQRASWNLGILVFSVVAFIRYVVVPLLFSLSGDGDFYPLREPSDDAKETALLIMIFELFSSFLVLQVFGRRFYPPRTLEVRRLVPSVPSSSFGLVIICALGIIFILIRPEIVQRYNFFVIREGVERATYNWSFSGLFLIVSDMLLVIPPILIMRSMRNKYNATKKVKYFLYALLSVIPFILIFKGVSRFSVLVPAVAWMVVMLRLFPEYKKTIIASLGVVAFSAFFIMTMYKQFGQTYGDIGSEKISISLGEAAYLGNAYFSHLYNMAYAVELGDKTSLFSGISVFYNDIFANLALISAVADKESTSVVMFNHHVYDISGKVDQIIPLSGQSYLYFGFLLSPLMMVMTVFFMMFFDRNLRSESRIEFVFLYSIAVIYFGMAMMLSFNSIYPFLFNVFVPLFIVFSANRRLAFKVAWS